MSRPITFSFNHRLIKQLVWIGCLVLLLGFVLPATTLALPPAPPGAETCIGCHPEETASWQNSPHARAFSNDKSPLGVTCETCHSSYVVGHPDQGVMQLTVDSSVCEDCHANTFGQWRHSTHAQAGVQCIGCHLSHSQEFRITEDALCYSCHRDRQEYYASTPHSDVGLTCVDCHFPSKPTGEMVFTSEDCSKCHGGTVHQTLGTLHQASTIQVANASMQPVVEADYPPELTTKLEMAQQTNESLHTMLLVYLGLGIGIGGMLGIVFMQVVGYVNQGRVKK